MLYDVYEKRIKRVAKVKNFAVKYRVILSILLSIMILFSGFFTFGKGVVTSDVVLPPTIIYGDEYNPDANALFTNNIQYEYSVVGSDVWTTEIPSTPGDYLVRAVTEKTFNRKGYSDPVQFTIHKKDLEIVINDSTMLYDNLPTDYSVSGLLKGHILENVEFKYEDIKAPSTNANIVRETIKIVDANNNDVTENYNIICADKLITFGPIILSVKPVGMEKIYDGSKIEYDNSFEVTSDKTFINNDTLSITTEIKDADGNVYNEVVNAGTYTNTIISHNVMNEGTDVSHHYQVSYQPNNLIINKRPITIYTDSISRNYNGLALTAYSNDNFGISENSEYQLVDGHSLKLIEEDLPSITNVSTMENSLKFDIIDNEGNIVTDNYEITYEYGTLEITKCPILVTTSSNSFVYDGESHFDNTFTLDIELPEGESAVVKGAYESLEKASTISNVFEVDIMKGEEVITSNYEISYEYGTIEVSKREITIEALINENTKVYDGTSVSYDNKLFTVTSELKIIEKDLDLLTVNVNILKEESEVTEAIDAGVYTFMISSHNGELDENYDIKLSDNGFAYEITKLDIELQAITIDSYTYDKGEFVYDGTQYTVVSDNKILERDAEIDLQVVASIQNEEKVEVQAINAGKYFVYLTGTNGALDNNYNISFSDIPTEFEIYKRDIYIQPYNEINSYDYQGSSVIEDPMLWSYQMEDSFTQKGMDLVPGEELKVTKAYFLDKDNNLVDQPINAGRYTWHFGEYGNEEAEYFEFVNADANNYNVYKESTTIKVLPRTVYIKLVDDVNTNNIYDGNIHIVDLSMWEYINVSATDSKHTFIEDDTFTISGYYTTIHNEQDTVDAINAGTYDVYIEENGIVFDDSINDGNYIINCSSSILEIYARPISIKGIDDIDEENIYDGLELEYDSTSWEYVEDSLQFIGLDNVIITTEVRDSEDNIVSPIDAGTYYLVITSITFAEGLESNYDINFEAKAELKIYPRPISIKGIDDVDEENIYDGEELEYSKDGWEYVLDSLQLIGDDNISITTEVRDSEENVVSPINVGTYNLIITSAIISVGKETNYTIDYSEKALLQIYPRPISVKLIDDIDEENIYDGEELEYDKTTWEYVEGSLELIGNDSFEINSSRVEDVDGNIISPVDVGVYYLFIDDDSITFTEGIKENYVIDYSTFATLQIYPRPISIKLIDDIDEENIYDGEVLEYDKTTWEYVDGSLELISPDDFKVLSSRVEDEFGNIIDPINVGTYYLCIDDDSIEFEVGKSSNYTIDYSTKATLQIHERPISIKGIDDIDEENIYDGLELEYDSTSWEYVEDSLQFIGLDNVIITTEVRDSEDNIVSPIDAGTYYLVITSITFINGLATNYDVDYSTKAELKIYKREVEIQAVDQPSKEYDGFEVIYPTYSFMVSATSKYDFVLSDNMFLEVFAKYVDEEGNESQSVVNAGKYLIYLTSTNGVLDHNYDITFADVPANYEIEKRLVYVKPVDDTDDQNIYNGEVLDYDAKGFSYAKDLSENEFVGEDYIELETEVYLNDVVTLPINADTYTIKIIDYTFIVGLDKNYIINTDSVGTLIIYPKEITIKPYGYDEEYIYNGEVMDYRKDEWVSSDGNWPLVKDDQLSVKTVVYNSNWGVEEPLNAGTYYLSIESYEFTAGIPTNYIVYHSMMEELIISPRPISIKGIDDKDFNNIYDGEELEYSKTGWEYIGDSLRLVGSDNITVSTIVRDELGNIVSPVDVGIYSLEITDAFISSGLATNYLIDASTLAELQIFKRSITLQAKPLDPVEYNGEEVLYPETQYVVSSEIGIVERDKDVQLTVNGIFTDASGKKVKAVNAGIYYMLLTEETSDLLDHNYDISMSDEPVEFEILRRKITIEAVQLDPVQFNGEIYEYDEDEFNVISENDIITNKERNSLEVVVEFRNALNEIVDPINAGIYYIYIVGTNGALDDNYEISYSLTGIEFEILKREVFIRPIINEYLEYDFKVLDYTYGFEYTKSGTRYHFVNEDTVTFDIIITDRDGIVYNELINAGNYIATIDESTLVYDTNNYVVICESKNFKVNTLEITVEVLDMVKEYDGVELPFIQDVTHFNMYYTASTHDISLLDVTLKPAYSKAPLNVGQYNIKVSGTVNNYDNSNFSFNIIEGTYTINQRNIVAEFIDQEFTYQGKTIEFVPVLGQNVNIISGDIVMDQKIVLDIDLTFNGSKVNVIYNSGTYVGSYVGYTLYDSSEKEINVDNYNIIISNEQNIFVHKKDVIVRAKDLYIKKGDPISYSTADVAYDGDGLFNTDYITVNIYYTDLEGNVCEPGELEEYYIRLDMDSIVLYSNGMMNYINNYNFIEDSNYGILKINTFNFTVNILSPLEWEYSGSTSYISRIKYDIYGDEQLEGICVVKPIFCFYDEEGNLLSTNPKNVGKYTIGVSGFDIQVIAGNVINEDNMTIEISESENNVLEITKRDISISAIEYEKQYDGKTYTPTLVVDRIASGDKLNAEINYYYNDEMITAEEAINVSYYTLKVNAESIYASKGSLDNYNILSVNDGYVNVIPREITISPNISFEKDYDGKEYVINGDEWVYASKSLELVNEDSIKVYFNFSGTRNELRDSEIVKNTKVFDTRYYPITEAYNYSIEINGVDFINGDRNNYNVLFTGKTSAKVHQLPLTVSTGSYEGYYNGEDIFVIDGIMASGTILDSHSVIYSGKAPTIVKGSTYKAGQEVKSVNNVISVSVYNSETNSTVDEYGNEYVGNYFFDEDSITWGKITVHPRPIAITTHSYSSVFTGSAQQYTEFDYSVVDGYDLSNTGLAPNDNFNDKFKNISKITNVEESGMLNKFDVVIVDSYGNDMSSSYDFRYTYGQLSLTPINITFSFDETAYASPIMYSGKAIDFANKFKFVDENGTIFKAKAYDLTRGISIIDEQGMSHTEVKDAHEYKITFDYIYILTNNEYKEGNYNLTIPNEEKTVTINISKIDVVYDYSNYGKVWDGKGDLFYKNYRFLEESRYYLDQYLEIEYTDKLVDYTILPQYIDGIPNTEACVDNELTICFYDEEGNDITHNFNLTASQAYKLAFSNDLTLQSNTRNFGDSDDFYLIDENGDKYINFRARLTNYDILAINVSIDYYIEGFEGELNGVPYVTDKPEMPGRYKYLFIDGKYNLYINNSLISDEDKHLYPVTYYDNYGEISSALNIERIDLCIKPLDYTYTYDGSAIEYNGYDIYEIIHSTHWSSLPDNYRLYVTTNVVNEPKTQRDVYIQSHQFEVLINGEWVVLTDQDQYFNVSYYTSKTEFVGSPNYYISYNEFADYKDYKAKYTFKQREVRVNTFDATKEYDGTPLLVSGYDYIQLVDANADLLPGHRFELTGELFGNTSSNAKVKGYSYQLTESKFGKAWNIYDEHGNDVSDYYTIEEVQEGKLYILPLDITIETGSSVKVFDGTAIENRTAWIIEGSLLDGQYIDLENTVFVYQSDSEEQAIWENVYENAIDKLVIKQVGENGKISNVNVKNYNITYKYGTLTIKPNI